MTIADWLRAATADAERRGVAGLPPLLESLAHATAALRSADCDQRADAPLSWTPALDEADDRAAASRPPGAPAAAGRDASQGTIPPSASVRAEGPATLGAAAAAIAARTVSSRALTDACLAAIADRNAALNAFVTVTADLARAAADAADREIAASGSRGPLHGIPISLKDLIDVAGVPTTAGSRVRSGLVASRDAPAAARLKAAGAVIVGKCNLHEFAFGTTSEDSAFGPARHPLDPTRSPGGSSGGSAAAVAAGLSFASVGTDTGGSIRIPAAACGVVGLKPTFGEIPCAGVVPLGRSLDHVGPIARSVADARAVYLALAGRAPREGRPMLPRRLGVLRPYFFDALQDEVRQAIERALDALRAAGSALSDAAVPHAALTAPVYLHTVLPEAAAYHAHTLESRALDYTPPVRVRLEMARYVLAEDYARAQAIRDILADEVDAALAPFEALVLPTLPIVAPVIGEGAVRVGTATDSVRTVTLRLTQLFDLTGHPAISIPVPVPAGTLPVGLQLVGRRWQTEALLDLAQAVEACLV